MWYVGSDGGLCTSGTRYIAMGGGTIYANYFFEGIAGPVYFGTFGASDVYFRTSNTGRWGIGSTTGHLLPVTTQTYNIGSASYIVNQIYTNTIYGGNNDILIGNPDPHSSSYALKIGFQGNAGDWSFDGRTIEFYTRNTKQWEIQALSGKLVPSSDTASSIGTSTNRLRFLHMNAIGGEGEGAIQSRTNTNDTRRHIEFYNSAQGTPLVGSISTNTTTTNYNTNSDIRTKKDINVVGNEVDSIFNAIEAKSFRFIGESDNAEKTIGFVAQDVLPHYSKSVSFEDDNENTLLSMDYSKMVGILWAVVKNLKQDVQEILERLDRNNIN